MYDNYTDTPAKIKVIGVGGGGGNAVNRMVESGMEGVEFWVMNTDKQVLDRAKVDEAHRIQLGQNATKGLGAGGYPSVGEQAAKESQEQITKAVEGADMVFITAGMGGGTGTGASPVIAQIAKDSGALTIAVVTKPFAFEGKRKMNFAVEGYNKLKDEVDSIIVVPNERLLEVAGNKATLIDAFTIADAVLTRGVQGISDIVALPGVVNVDFADVQSIMKNSGTALMGIGVMSGEGRAVQAANAAINSPLIESSLKGATGVIVNVTGGSDMTLFEINAASQVIQKEIADDANFTFGAVINENIMNSSEIQVTVIATGFDMKPAPEAPKQVDKLNVNDFFSGKMGNNNNNANTQNIAPKASAPQQQAPKVEQKTDFPINYGNQPNNGQKSVDIDLPPFLK